MVMGITVVFSNFTHPHLIHHMMLANNTIALYYVFSQMLLVMLSQQCYLKILFTIEIHSH